MKLWDEFKAFAFKGNMLDLAVAVVIGAAFGKVISSMVDNVIMPLIGLIMPAKPYTDWVLGPVKIGLFLGNVLDFLIVALAVFLVLVKVIGSLTKKPAPAAPPPAVKECPMCLSVIPQKARKCAHCTSDLP